MIRQVPTTIPHRIHSKRHAAAAVESTIILVTFLMLILGMLDFGLAVLNRNNLEMAACRLARSAIVHGENSAAVFNPWGPDSFTGVANDGSEAAQVVSPVLAIMPKDDVQIHLDWPDGSNAVGQRVRVTMSYDHQPLFAGLFGTSTWNLRAVSTMRIQH
ncbi:hypothetical protein GC163_08735 [bacterium]|nr:hypothetical protein [bacterium]